MVEENIINVQNLNKIYKLYDKPSDRLKEVLSVRKKELHTIKYALRDINFEVKKGETVGIIGTNGSGKSTLLKIITGVLNHTTGTVDVKGKVSALLELGAGFNPEYTGLQNIYLNGRMMNYSKSEMDKRVDAIVDFADIGDYIYQPVKMYSSGMFARLAFAVAINVEPEILIVDEALSVGDIFFQNKCFRKFEELRKKGVTILFVSHDIESVKSMTSRVLWIEKGQQRMFGDKLEVCNEYAKSILYKNNDISAVGETTNRAVYKKGKFELESFPTIYPNNNNMLSEKVKIISCFFENINGEVVYEIIGNQKYKLVIIFETKELLENCIVGFVLQNKKGVSIINTNTLLSGEKRNFVAKKESYNRVEFEFTFPMLYSDVYIVDCAIANGRTTLDNIMHTWCYGATKIMVKNECDCLAMLTVAPEISIYEKTMGDVYECI